MAMFNIEDVLQLKDREEVRHVTRRHVLTMFPPLLLSLVLIVVPFFLMFPLFSWGIIGVGLFVVAVFSGIGIALRTLLLWDADILIVTTLRLVDVDQRGIFARTVSEAPLESVQDVSWSRNGILQTVFRMGDLKVQTAGSTANIEAKSIPRVEVVHELINELRQPGAPKHQASAPVAAAKPLATTDSDDKAGRIQSICAMLEKYSAEELGRIESILKARERAAVADAFLAQDGKDES
jgi:membrane protein YdbS with pleckstrin-like domain